MGTGQRASRRRVDGERVYMQVRIDPDLLSQLDREAEERDVSRTYLIETMVRDWLETHAIAG